MIKAFSTQALTFAWGFGVFLVFGVCVFSVLFFFPWLWNHSLHVLETYAEHAEGKMPHASQVDGCRAAQGSPETVRVLPALLFDLLSWATAACSPHLCAQGQGLWGIHSPFYRTKITACFPLSRPPSFALCPLGCQGSGSEDALSLLPHGHVGRLAAETCREGNCIQQAGT